MDFEQLTNQLREALSKAQGLALYLLDLNVQVEDLSDAQALAGPDAL